MSRSFRRALDTTQDKEQREPLETAGETLRAWRRQRRLTQKQVAERVGYNAQSVSDWEIDKYAPLTETVFALDAVLEAGGAIIAAYRLAPPAEHDLLTKLTVAVERMAAELVVLRAEFDAHMARGDEP